MQRSYVYEVWLALHPYHPHSSKNGQGNGHSVVFQMLNERRLWFQDHQVGWAGAICPPSPSSFSHFSEWVLTGEAPFLPFHCEILSQGWWWLRLGDKGKRIEKRFFSPTPKRREGRQKNHLQPPKTAWCLHPWWDGLSQINKLCTGKKWDRSSTHTMGANLCQSQRTTWDKQTNQRHPNLATYNTFLEKMFKCFLILKVVLKWLWRWAILHPGMSVRWCELPPSFSQAIVFRLLSSFCFSIRM